MKQIVASRHFQKQLNKLPDHDLEKVLEAIDAFRKAIHSNTTSKGLGLKKIAANKYEIRVDLKIRIGITEAKDILVLDLVGNHEEIRNFLKNY